jgi:hypothetical protein
MSCIPFFRNQAQPVATQDAHIQLQNERILQLENTLSKVKTLAQGLRDDAFMLEKEYCDDENIKAEHLANIAAILGVLEDPNIALPNEVEKLQKRILELEHESDLYQQDYFGALDKNIQQTARNSILRQEQSKKIVGLWDEIRKRDEIIASLNVRIKDVHEQGYEVICAKEDEITQLKNTGIERHSSMESNTLEDDLERIRSELQDMKLARLAFSGYTKLKDASDYDLARSIYGVYESEEEARNIAKHQYLNSRPYKEYKKNSFRYWDAIRRLAEEIDDDPF